MIEFIVLSVAALLIGVSKGGFGGAVGVLVGPLLAMIFPAKEAVGLMLPMLLACDVVSLVFYWQLWDNWNIICLLPGAAVGVGLGALALGALDNDLLARIMGGCAIGFTALHYVRGQANPHAPPYVPTLAVGFLAGMGTGFISALSHVGGLITTMFLLVQKLDNRRFVGTAALLYFVINVLKIPFYIHLDMVRADSLVRVAPYFPVILAGTALGVWLNRRVSSLWFTRIVQVLVVAAGIMLLVRT